MTPAAKRFSCILYSPHGVSWNIILRVLSTDYSTFIAFFLWISGEFFCCSILFINSFFLLCDWCSWPTVLRCWRCCGLDHRAVGAYQWHTCPRHSAVSRATASESVSDRSLRRAARRWPAPSLHSHVTPAYIPHDQRTRMPSVLWCCWLGCRKGIWPVKTEWWGAGMVICLERGADLHMAQLMPLPLTVSCFSKIQTAFTFLLPSVLWRCWLGSRKGIQPVVPEKGPLNGCVCVFSLSGTGSPG